MDTDSSLGQSHLRQSVFICGQNQPRISSAVIVRATVSRSDVAEPIDSIEVPIDQSDVANPLMRCKSFGSASTDSQWRQRPIISSDEHYSSLRSIAPKCCNRKSKAHITRTDSTTQLFNARTSTITGTEE